MEPAQEAIEEAFEAHERRWATEAWSALRQAGLANYSTELERCEAAINFIALVEFYKDWQEGANEGNREFSYGSLPEFLGLSPFRVGQLVGSNPELLATSANPAHNLVGDAGIEPAWSRLRGECINHLCQSPVKNLVSQCERWTAQAIGEGAAVQRC